LPPPAKPCTTSCSRDASDVWLHAKCSVTE
jgi:hypothetical protein